MEMGKYKWPEAGTVSESLSTLVLKVVKGEKGKRSWLWLNVVGLEGPTGQFYFILEAEEKQ